MKITVTDNEGRVHKAKKPYEDANFVETEMTCPHCGEENIKVAGTGKIIDPERRHDTYRADAVHYSTDCNKSVGVLRVKIDSFFGLEEDERIANMGIRIY
jgi:hypothetical protein